MCQEAVQLSYRILKHLSAWRCRIHELLAWRKSAPTLHESLHSLEDGAGYNRIPSRVIRIFHDSDVHLVLETLVCVDGLAHLFRKKKECIVPSVTHWLNHVVQLFLEQTSKKRGLGTVDTRKVLHTIENLKSHILEGRHALLDSSPTEMRSAAELKFDARHPDGLTKLRKAAEELYFLCSHHNAKSKISSYICGHPGAVAPGVHKATRDLLCQLYMMQEVLKSDEHLEKILDFSDLSLREREIEVTGSVNLNRGSVVALQLAQGAINCPYGGSLEPVFTALKLFDGAAEKLLTVYRSQLIYLELRQTAMEGLEVLLDEICRQAMIQAKSHACVVSLDHSPRHWIDELHGVPNRAAYKFDCVFQTKTLCLAGYDIDIQQALVDRLNAQMQFEYNKIFRGLEMTKDPTFIVSCNTRIEILKAAHECLSRQLPLSAWIGSNPEGPDAPMSRLSGVIKDCLVYKLLREFSFDMRARSFKAFQENSAEPFSFRLCPRPSTPKINFCDVLAGQKENSAFGFRDVCVIHEMMTPQEMQQLIADVQGAAVEELRQFLTTRLDNLLDFIPLELINLRISDLAHREDLTAIESLSYVLEKFGTDVAETAAWVDPLRSLERIGNALILLYLLQICLLQSQTASSIQQCTSIGDVVSYFTDSSDRALNEDEDSGNPFEMQLRKKRASTPERIQMRRKPVCEILQDCVQMMRILVETSDQQDRLNMKNAISTVLLLKTYAQANARMINVSYGDGVLWAANLLTQLLPECKNFERVDWIHEILRLGQLDDVLHSIQTSNDIRAFLTQAQKVTSTWRQVSLLKLYRPNKMTPIHARDAQAQPELNMMEDAPLRGFYGGMYHVPHTARRRTRNLSGCMGPLRASMIKNKTHQTAQGLYARPQMGSTSGDPFSRRCPTGRSFATHEPQEPSLRMSFMMWNPNLGESTSSLHQRHSS